MRWYKVLVETKGEKYLIAIEAISSADARSAIAKDLGAKSIREVSRL